jgi:hypothetical protein
VLLFFAVAISGATTKTKKAEGEETKTNNKPGLSLMQSTSSRARRAASSPAGNNQQTNTSFSSNRYRMQEFSLADHVAKLSNSDNHDSFERLLSLEQEKRQEAAKAVSTKNTTSLHSVSPQFMTALGGTSVIAAAAWFLDPLTIATLWKTSIWKRLGTALAVAWLPLLWAHPTGLALVDFLILVQLARQPTVIPYLQKQVFPVVWKSLHAMIVTEL